MGDHSKFIMHQLLLLLLLSPAVIQADPKAKEVIYEMDEAIKSHVAWDDWEKWSALMAQYFTEDMIYDTNYFDGTNEFMGNGTGILSWWDREHIPINEAFDNQTFNQMIFAAEEDFATTTTYAIAPWDKGPFCGVPAPNKVVRYRIFDFYIMRDDKIWYNWMILDCIHLLYQAGYEVLPNNLTPLKQGESRVPNAMDGLPAPWSRSVNPEDSIIAKAIAQQVLEHDLLRDRASPYWRNDMVWYGSYGFGMAENYEEYSYFFVEALSKAFTNRELEVMLLVCEGNYCGAIGYLHGDFTGEFLGEQPSNLRTKLRFGLHWHIDTEKNEVIEGYGMFDLQEFFVQSGIDLYQRAQNMNMIP